MKTRRTLSRVLLILGSILAVCTVAAAFRARSAQPVMRHSPQAAEQRAEAMMAAVCSGDYQAASRMLYGTPSLGEIPQDASPSAFLIWDAFLKSLAYEFPGTCYVTEDGVTLDVKVGFLDVNAALEGLDVRTEKLLDQHIQAAEDSSQLYDEDNNFRQELIEEVLTTAVFQALGEETVIREKTISLRMVFSEDQWWVMPDKELLEVLSGSVT